MRLGSLFVCLVRLVCFVYLVDFVHLVSFVQPNEQDKPDKQDRPVSALPTAAASELKDADPAAEPLYVTSWRLDTSP